MALGLDEQLRRAKTALTNASFERFYGTVTFHYEGGNIVRMTKHESIRLEDLDDGEAKSDEAK